MKTPLSSSNLLPSLILLSCLTGSVAAQITGPGVRPSGLRESSLQPWSPSMTSSAENKVVYGDDDRQDLYEVSNPFAAKLANSVCAMVYQGDLSDNGNGTWSLIPAAYQVFGLPACPSEPFGDQPSIADCTGFLIGEDIIATAGHCYDTGDYNNTLFVFGYHMLDASTPVLTLSDNQVYQGIEVLAHEYNSNDEDDDYTILRLDRKVTAPGAFPLKIRRADNLEYGQPVGMIGYPSGLPLKVAWGNNTQAYHTNPIAYFYANLDAYGGNSGSPVFNQETGVVEGILVRGATDFIRTGNCFVSNTINDEDAGQDPYGEEVQKTIRFESIVPETTGQINFSQSAYTSGGTLELSIWDDNAVTSTVSVELATESGDLETVVLSDNDLDQIYTGSIPVGSASKAVSVGNGTIEGSENDIILATYADNDSGDGAPFTFAASSSLDFTAPQVVSISDPIAYPEGILIEVETNEKADVTLAAGEIQGTYPSEKTSSMATVHKVYLDGLTEGTDYFCQVVVTDRAGNKTTVDQIAAQPIEVKTLYWYQKIWGQDFESGNAPGWSSQTTTGSDSWSVIDDANASSGTKVYGLVPTNSGTQNIVLQSPNISTGDILRFKQTYNLDPGYDVGLLEINENSTGNWTDLNDSIAKNGYTSYIREDLFSLIASEKGWSGGFFGPMEEVIVDLRDFTGSKQIGWHFASNYGVTSGGWLIDDVELWTVSDVPLLGVEQETWLLY